MYCLKCGTKIDSNQVFCAHCLETMDQYPVKPGTAVHLPPKSGSSPQKKSAHRKRVIPPEEQLQRLRGHVHRLIISTVVLAVLLACVSGVFVYKLYSADKKTTTGQNYKISATDPVTAFEGP